MPGLDGVQTVVVDVLGTLVDERQGLHAEISLAAPWADEAFVDRLVTSWQAYVADQQRLVVEGRRGYVEASTLDAEAAELVASQAGTADPQAVRRLASARRRLPAWPDSADALTRLARRVTVVALSNAGTADLDRLRRHAGLRWHHAVSSDDARAYKPAPRLYARAVDVAGGRPEGTVMVAAHTWDLRGARAAGMRTAYVHRPGGDPPRPDDVLDAQLDSLTQLAATV